MFPSKRAARQAASEILGNMGNNPTRLTMETYDEINELNNPYRDIKKEKVYGLVFVSIAQSASSPFSNRAATPYLAMFDKIPASSI